MAEKVEQRKARLRAELRQIEERLEERFQCGVNVLDTVFPVGRIRRYPIRALLFAAGLGFLIGIVGKRRRTRGRFFRSAILHMLTDEVKRIAAKRAFHYMVDIADTAFRQRFGIGTAREPRSGGDR